VMGKPKSLSKKAKKLHKKVAAVAGGSYDIDQLLDKASDLLDEYNYELAQKFIGRALEQDADNVRALEMSGSLLLEVGEGERAKQCLGRAIHLEPQTGHTKYLMAAQLFSGVEARDLYLKGVEILQANIQSAAGTREASPEDASAVSSALVAVSELYTTDLCDTEEAEAEAKRFIDLAIQADQGNSEAWEALANYSLITGQVEAAQEAMSTSLELWLPAHLSFCEGGVEVGQQTRLSYHSRLTTAKLLLDLEVFDRATEVLDSLLEEDDEVVATWYLLGWLNFLRDDPDYHGNVRHYLSKAQQVHSMNPTEDAEMIQHIAELLEEVGQVDTSETEASEDISLVAENDTEKLDKIADILDKDDEDPETAMED